MPIRDPAWFRAHYRQRRAQGLCAQCGLESPRMFRCLFCRLERRAVQAKHDRRRRRNQALRDARNRRQRELYAQKRAA